MDVPALLAGGAPVTGAPGFPAPFAPLAGLPAASLVIERAAVSGAGLDVTEAERRLTDRMVPARAEEFLAGRHLVRRILRERWPDRAPGFSLLPDPERRPVWPPGLVGSITHSGGRVAAALAEAAAVRGIGIDIQEIPDEDTARDVGRVVAPRELADGLGLPDAEAVGLVLSLKESLFKCLNPTFRQFIDFPDVEVFPDLARGTCAFRRVNAAKLWPEEPLTAVFGRDGPYWESAVLWPR